ncbi:helix-turn-helix domain-containing protein [Paracoccus chinensis]|uniref:DNA binding domain-containing protein, excisionase family n=1 Tax=Paracoccus chinensis TaxID=525640 RepID=A0A1G9JFW1_9RHOB|nr:helix-turn-helix domain-containing protein [Paracoccus chinensis]SDL36135.1 DNA binding domain-containing protein, excisionase family [Paracoccus chinensis]
MTDDLMEHLGLSQRLPTTDEIQSAAEAAVALANAIEVDGCLKIGDHGSVKIAPAIGELISDLLGHVSRGEMVTIVPTSTMLSTQQAADMLNVSRPFLSRLLKEGKIGFVQVGTHRRVPLEKLLAYRAEREREQDAALSELARLGQECDRA